MGRVTQILVPGALTMMQDMATVSQFNSTMSSVREVGEPMYLQGQSYDVEGITQTIETRQEQVCLGEAMQNVVEIVTVSEETNVVEIPEVQVLERSVEVPQIVQKPVEVVRQQHVEIPRIFPQERVQERRVEQIVDVPVPQMVEEKIEVPKIFAQERIQHVAVEQILDVPVPQTVEEVIEVPKIFPQERVTQNVVEKNYRCTCTSDC